MNSTAEQFIAELREDPNVLGVLLFGSWARGNQREDSDIDLIVIVRDGFRRVVGRQIGLLCIN